MPLAPCIAAVRRDATGFRLVGDERDLGVIRMAVARQRVLAIELAETATEIDVLFTRDVLVTEQQNAVLQKRLVDFAEGAFAHRPTTSISHTSARERTRAFTT